MLAASLAAFGARSPRVVDLGSLVSDPGPGASLQTLTAAEMFRGFTAIPGRDWATAVDSFRRGFALLDSDPVDELAETEVKLGALLPVLSG